VGSTLRFFPGLSLGASASFSLLGGRSSSSKSAISVVGLISLGFTINPLTLLLALCVRPAFDGTAGRGVSGGVIQLGTIPGTGPELAAATDGTDCTEGVGCMRIAEFDEPWL
jgi:hypothetical protein